jgi:hypothetical protein
MTSNSYHFNNQKLDTINAAFLKKEDAQSVEYARIVLQGLLSIYKEASLTGDKTLNLILGRAPFMRNFALSLVTGHEVYNRLLELGYKVNFWYDRPAQHLTGLTMIMEQPFDDDRDVILEQIEKSEYYGNRV